MNTSLADTVLVVAAHPDDEVLGCGGAIAKHAASGDQVEILILAEGLKARSADADSGELQALHDSARKAAAVLGASAPEFAGFPDNKMDTAPLLDIVQRIEETIARLSPRTIYTHFANDLNVDHQLTARAVAAACRPLPQSSIKSIYAFETPSSTEWAPDDVFRPTRFVEISEDALARKLRALDCYTSEMRDFPHPRSSKAVEALARWRGATAGVEAAECFEIIRQLA